jgi:hypothetical protein
MHIDAPSALSMVRFQGAGINYVYNIRFDFPISNARHVEHDAAPPY